MLCTGVAGKRSTDLKAKLPPGLGLLLESDATIEAGDVDMLHGTHRRVGDGWLKGDALVRRRHVLVVDDHGGVAGLDMQGLRGVGRCD